MPYAQDDAFLRDGRKRLLDFLKKHQAAAKGLARDIKEKRSKKEKMEKRVETIKEEIEVIDNGISRLQLHIEEVEKLSLSKTDGKAQKLDEDIDNFIAEEKAAFETEIMKEEAKKNKLEVKLKKFQKKIENAIEEINFLDENLKRITEGHSENMGKFLQ